MKQTFCTKATLWKTIRGVEIISRYQKLLPCQAKCTVSQKIKTKTQAEYFWVLLHEHLHFKKQIDTVKQKLLTTTGLPSKLRHYVPKKVLETIHYVIFDSNIRHSCQIWWEKS